MPTLCGALQFQDLFDLSLLSHTLFLSVGLRGEDGDGAGVEHQIQAIKTLPVPRGSSGIVGLDDVLNLRKIANFLGTDLVSEPTDIEQLAFLDVHQVAHIEPSSQSETDGHQEDPHRAHA